MENISSSFYEIVYYVMRSKNEALCAAVGRLAAERSETDKPVKAHKTIFAPNNIQGVPKILPYRVF
jgi:hypothetical protein